MIVKKSTERREIEVKITWKKPWVSCENDIHNKSNNK